MTNGERMLAVWHKHFFGRTDRIPPDHWSIQSPESKACFSDMAAAMIAPNQLTSAELGKLVEALERCQATCPDPECGVTDLDWESLRDTWLPRVREAWLSLVRWEADHG